MKFKKYSVWWYFSDSVNHIGVLFQNWHWVFVSGTDDWQWRDKAVTAASPGTGWQTGAGHGHHHHWLTDTGQAPWAGNCVILKPEQFVCVCVRVPALQWLFSGNLCKNVKNLENLCLMTKRFKFKLLWMEIIFSGKFIQGTEEIACWIREVCEGKT